MHLGRWVFSDFLGWSLVWWDHVLKIPEITFFCHRSKCLSQEDHANWWSVHALSFASFPQAFQEILSLQLDIQAIPYDINNVDTWNFLWGDSNYTSRRFYQLAFKHLALPQSFKWVWKSKCTPRLKFFARLILMDRLNTKDMLQRRNFHVQPNTHCVMCNAGW